MKRFVISLAFMAVATLMSAVPAKKGIWKTVRLADGTEVRVELKGDEFGHCWMSEDGTGYVKKAGTDIYERADMKQLTADAAERRQSRNAERTKARRQAVGQTRTVLGGEHTPYIGTKKGIIILVEFDDKKFAEGHDRELYNRIANEEGFKSDDGFVGSVKDYFSAQSDGLFTLDFDVAGPYTMPKGYAYYGGNGPNYNDVNVRSMVTEACKQADKDVNFADYDWDNDGYVDQVFILYAGRGEADGGDENTIWPHESSLGNPIALDGVYVNTYACSNELRSETDINGIGTICHEFSHCMGLPDFYDTQYGGNFGMGPWDPMSSGSYLGNSFCPAGYTSYERMYCGWKQPTVIDKDTTITGMKGLCEGGETFIMYNDGNKDEYYLFENRTRTGWDSQLYGSGMLVIHVDFKSYIWSSNYVNTTVQYFNDHQRCTIIHADNKDGENTVTDLAGDPFPYGSINMLAKTTTPATSLYNKNADGSYFMDKSIMNITKDSNGDISFKVMKNSDMEAEKPEGALFYESFDFCMAQGGNDGLWTGSNVGSGSFVPDNEGWTAANRFGGYQCARFGSNVQNGNATTPEFEIDGETELTFKAAAWPGDGTALSLTATGDDVTLSTTSFRLGQGQWGEYKTTVTGNGKVKITFKAARKRFYLDEVLVMKAGNTAISSVSPDRTGTGDTKIYTLDGRSAGNDLKSLGKGIYIVNGRKVVR